MWPVLTPAHLLHDLFRSPNLLASASRGLFSPDQLEAVRHPFEQHADDVVWAFSDAPLLDEARAHLGARPGKKDVDEVRTYGHIVIDEAQDLSPMALRMVSRRSLNGSMTIVGDIAQATGSWARDSWDEVIEALPQRRPPARRELTTGYRIPAPAMALAAKVLTAAAPNLTPPVAIRTEGTEPLVQQVDDLAAALPGAIQVELELVDAGNVAVIVPRSLLEPLSEALRRAGVAFGGATRAGLDQQVTLVPVQLVKGLEVDSAIVVEPSSIVHEERQGMRALYVALTRATKRVGVLHTDPLPEILRSDRS
jgi:DNA helicase IV